MAEDSEIVLSAEEIFLKKFMEWLFYHEIISFDTFFHL